MRNLMCRGCCLLIVAGLLGCQTKQISDDRMILEPAAAADFGYQVRWATDLGLPPDARVAHVAIIGDTIVAIEAATNLVTGLSLRDGSYLWRRALGSPGENMVSAFGDNERIFVHSEGRLFHLSAETGEITTISELDEAVSAPPAVSLQHNRAIFGGSRGMVFAHDLTAGRANWRYKTNAGIVAPPVMDGNSVLVANSAGIYVLLTIDQRDVQWSGRTFARITARPILTNLGVFIPSEDGTLYALQRINGNDRWTFRSTQALTRDPLLNRSTIYLPVPDRGLVALNAISGDVLWEDPTQALPIGVTPRGLLLNDRTKLMLLDADRGTPLREAPTLWMQNVLQGPNGALLLVSPYGKLERIDPR